MTQLLILGGIVSGLAALYLYVSNNRERFAKKNEPPKGPSNIIYLPADLETHKNTEESSAEDEDRK